MSDISKKITISDTARIITLANGLSILRAFLAFPIIYCLSIGNLVWTVFLILGAILTDILDGFFARRAHKVTNLGKVLDPTADGVVILSVVLFLALDSTRNFPIWFLMFYTIRYLSIALTAVYVMNHYSVIFSSNILGKWTITILYLAIFLYVIRIESFGFYCLLIASTMAVLSWIQYLFFFMSYLRK